MNEINTLPNPFDIKNNNYLNINENINIMEDIDREIDDGPFLKNPNFPFFFPLIYHNINLEIKEKYSSIVRICYYSDLSIFWNLFFSFITTLFSFQINQNYISIIQEIILSLFFLIILPSLIFYIQYYPVYCSFKDELPFKGLFIIQIYIIFIYLFILIGFCGTGIIGILSTIRSLKYGKFINQFLSIIITIWHIFNLMTQFILIFLLKPVFSFTNY